jgi:DNA-binding NarL/FixJ family response regulator
MRLLVIDDEQLVLEGLEAFLQAALPDVSLDKTADASTATSLVGAVPYEVVLLDWNLTDPSTGKSVDPQELVRRLREAGCASAIIVVSGDERQPWAKLVLDLGLSGFVPKAASGATLIDAIQVAQRGGVYLPAFALNQQMRPPYRRALTPASAPAAVVDPAARFPELTERQAEVFRAMARGASDKKIALDLGIGESTVKSHVRAILGVVGVHRRGEAVFRLSDFTPD